MSLAEAQQMVDDWIRSVGVDYFSELTNLAQLVEEVGELARVMSRQFGDQTPKSGETQTMADELGDVLFVLTCIANQTGVNLEDALRAALEKNTRRDAARHAANPALAKRKITRHDPS